MTRSEAREHAFRILFETEFQTGEDLGALIDTYLENFNELDSTEKDLSFIKGEVLGVMEHLETIDEAISSNLRGWTLKRIARCDRAILRLAVYEIRFVDSIPVSVSINEAIELAKKYSEQTSGGFVNGVLANFAQKKNPAEEA